MGVDENLVEGDAFALQRLEDEVVDGPEGVFLEVIGAQTILVAHHHKLEIQLLADEGEVTDGTFRELQLLEAVDLLVGRFLDNRTVTVYK